MSTPDFILLLTLKGILYYNILTLYFGGVLTNERFHETTEWTYPHACLVLI
jgi:hypothetical protein